MLTDAKGKTFQMVLVAKLDRIAHDLMAQLWIEKELLKREVELVSAAEPFRGQDPSSVLFRQIIGAFAQFEKAHITERMGGGRKQKAWAGGYADGCPPIGHHAVRGSKVLHFDPVKAEAVVRVLTLRRQHPRWTLQQIAAQVNADGYTTAHGAAFQPVTIKRILDRRDFYTGQYRYADVKAAGIHQQILSKEVASPKKRGRVGQPAA
jgi:site-specific DNA recombinase